ncbi:MAG: Hsp20/alpha crystallin family protein [Leptospira sp.]|nr:Hsp20/alpha crystallin family protein [Leptospira sp.]
MRVQSLVLSREDFHNIFEGNSVKASSFPAVNVYSNEEKVTITAELPGVNGEDLDITVVGNSLKIEGESREVFKDQEVSSHRTERSYGKFSRTLELPFEVDSSKVGANLVNGILTIELPIKESEKPRQIKIKVG